MNRRTRALHLVDSKNSGLDYVTLYVVGNATLHETILSGDTVPTNQRPYLATTLVLPFHLAGGAAAELYYHFLIYQSPALGIASDALLLSLALADPIRLLQRARMIAEELARQNLEIRSEELERLVAERTAEIKTLHGILPICANCKKIRNEEGAWQGLETYISQHTDAQFSHGICVDCIAELYPEIHRKRQQNRAN